MSDVLFDTGKFTLRPDAREKPARVAGIIEGHPGLKLAVEGCTDSVGGGLSHFGGFRQSQPVAANDTRMAASRIGAWKS